MDREEAIAALVSLPAVTRISVANLKPADVLVIECDKAQRISDDVAENIRALMKQIWPNHKAVVMCDGARLKVMDGEADQPEGRFGEHES